MIWMVSVASIPNSMPDYTGFVYRKKHRIIPDYEELPYRPAGSVSDFLPCPAFVDGLQ